MEHITYQMRLTSQDSYDCLESTGCQLVLGRAANWFSARDFPPRHIIITDQSGPRFVADFWISVAYYLLLGSGFSGILKLMDWAFISCPHRFI